MGEYDYYVEVMNDIECWMDNNNFDLHTFSEREEAAEYLHDELWAEDSITGNGPNGYASEKECEEFLCHNLDLIIEAIDTYGISTSDLRAQYTVKKLARYLDCLVRLYVLPNAIEGALIAWEEYGFKYKNN